MRARGGYWSVCGRLKFSGRWASYSCLALLLPISTILCKGRKRERERKRERKREREKEREREREKEKTKERKKEKEECNVNIRRATGKITKNKSNTHSEFFHLSHLHSTQFAHQLPPMHAHTQTNTQTEGHTGRMMSRLN